MRRTMLLSMVLIRLSLMHVHRLVLLQLLWFNMDRLLLEWCKLLDRRLLSLLLRYLVVSNRSMLWICVGACCKWNIGVYR